MTTRAADRLDGMTSLLFAPAGNARLIGSAARRAVDVVILDLEDAIPADQKAAARHGIADDIDLLRAGTPQVCVRVNRPWTMLVPDIVAVAAAKADFVMLPKIETAAQIDVAAEILDELGSDAALIAQIETALGLTNMPETARRRGDRLAALMLGPEDLALDLGASATQAVMMPHAANLVAAAGSGGLAAIGSPGSIAETRDMGAYESQLAAGRAMGFDAVAAIHPTQLDVIARIYRPDAEALAEAGRIVAENETSGGRPFMLDGRMIDAPIVARARAILKRSGR